MFKVHHSNIRGQYLADPHEFTLPTQLSPPSSNNAASVIALTPVRIVRSGGGARRGECRGGEVPGAASGSPPPNQNISEGIGGSTLP